MRALLLTPLLFFVGCAPAIAIGVRAATAAYETAAAVYQTQRELEKQMAVEEPVPQDPNYAQVSAPAQPLPTQPLTTEPAPGGWGRYRWGMTTAQARKIATLTPTGIKGTFIAPDASIQAQRFQVVLIFTGGDRLAGVGLKLDTDKFKHGVVPVFKGYEEELQERYGAGVYEERWVGDETLKKLPRLIEVAVREGFVIMIHTFETDRSKIGIVLDKEGLAIRYVAKALEADLKATIAADTQESHL